MFSHQPSAQLWCGVVETQLFFDTEKFGSLGCSKFHETVDQFEQLPVSFSLNCESDALVFTELLAWTARNIA